MAIEDAQAISDHKPKSKLAIADQPKEELSPSKLSKSKRKQTPEQEEEYKLEEDTRTKSKKMKANPEVLPKKSSGKLYEVKI